MLRTGFELVVSRAYAFDPAHYAAFWQRRTSSRRACPSCWPRRPRSRRTTPTPARPPGLQVPTLVIHGSADDLLAPINGDLVASLIPGARLELLDDAGHLFFWGAAAACGRARARVRPRRVVSLRVIDMGAGG